MASKKETKEVESPVEVVEPEDGKLDIEDIKDPFDELEKDDNEQEEVVPELQPEPAVKESPKLKKEKRSFFGGKKEPKPKKEAKIKEDSSELTPESVLPKKKGPLGTIVTILVTVLVTAALVLGGVYAYTKYFKEEAPMAVPEAKIEGNEVIADTEKYVYINSTAGLNLRKEPTTVAEILAIIPNGTKVKVIEEDGGWYKVEYDSKEGWISKEFTTETALAAPTTKPITYTSGDYGFTLTLPAAWQGYKVIPKQVNWGTFTTTTYYFALPTTDTKWTESGVTKGYASLFAITPFTKAQWAQVDENDKSRMDILEETMTHTFTGAPGQASPTDLSARYKEAVNVLKTFKIE